MLVAADWVLPIVGEPIREGAVLVRSGSVEAVGRLDDLRPLHPDASLVEFPGCVLAPGLVNAHTHLSLTMLEGLLEPQPFAEWLPLVAKVTRGMDADDFAAATLAGALESLAHGVTVVGDVAYGPEGLTTAAEAGLGGTFYWEVLGADPEGLESVLQDIGFPAVAPRCGLRTRCGLSAHAVYSCGPRLIRALRRRAAEDGIPFMVHAAESPAETELLMSGTGPLSPTASRLAHGFSPPRTGSVRYLDGLGAAEGATLVHCVQLQPDEFDLLPKTAGVVLCPRSNAFLQVGAPDVERIVASGANVALGTDSAGSNRDLDLRAEARALRALMPSLSPARLLRMMTVNGARALGLEGEFGCLAPGAKADLVAYSVDSGTSPEEAVLESGREHVRAVMSGGVWRVREGELPSAPAPSPGMTRAVRKARTALAS